MQLACDNGRLFLGCFPESRTILPKSHLSAGRNLTSKELYPLETRPVSLHSHFWSALYEHDCGCNFTFLTQAKHAKCKKRAGDVRSVSSEHTIEDHGVLH
jgi:hypothetical protein